MAQRTHLSSGGGNVGRIIICDAFGASAYECRFSVMAHPDKRSKTRVVLQLFSEQPAWSYE